MADKAIDGNPATTWPTDTYYDPVPFPGFKNGVGLMLQLPQPTTVGSVNVGVTSTGTQIQIRSSTTATPATLEDTTALTQPTSVQPGHNTITVNAAAPTSYVLVWISTLGSDQRRRAAPTSPRSPFSRVLTGPSCRPVHRVHSGEVPAVPGSIRPAVGSGINGSGSNVATPNCWRPTSRVTATRSRSCSTATTGNCTGSPG